MNNYANFLKKKSIIPKLCRIDSFIKHRFFINYTKKIFITTIYKDKFKYSRKFKNTKKSRIAITKIDYYESFSKPLSSVSNSRSLFQPKKQSIQLPDTISYIDLLSNCHNIELHFLDIWIISVNSAIFHYVFLKTNICFNNCYTKSANQLVNLLLSHILL